MGRIGQAGTVRHTSYETVRAAERYCEERQRAKLKRGYQASPAA